MGEMDLPIMYRLSTDTQVIIIIIIITFILLKKK